ncbi:MAG: hypothetical protein FK734_00805 [Asgard group archaeon]|nr:hypothetical protein [Asgard group archaeon]
MFKRSQEKKKPETNLQITLLITPKILEILQLTSEEISAKQVNLDEERITALLSHLEKVTALTDLRLKFLKEITTTTVREKQLNETKTIVESLRETDKTSGSAMSFLKEKLDLLIKEREDLSFKILELKEKITTIDYEQLADEIKAFVFNIQFLDAASWEKDLDYYRTRFLLQREQEEDDTLKEEFREKEERLLSDEQLAEELLAAQTVLEKEKITFTVTKRDFQKIMPLVNDYNSIISKLPAKLAGIVLTESAEELIEEQKKQEEKSFETGKELYALKREQGILTLKTYEIIQTLRSRLLNITGSIASRNFLINGFKELVDTAQDQSLAISEKLASLNTIIDRLLRILS